VSSISPSSPTNCADSINGICTSANIQPKTSAVEERDLRSSFSDCFGDGAKAAPTKEACCWQFAARQSVDGLDQPGQVSLLPSLYNTHHYNISMYIHTSIDVCRLADLLYCLPMYHIIYLMTYILAASTGGSVKVRFALRGGQLSHTAHRSSICTHLRPHPRHPGLANVPVVVLEKNVPNETGKNPTWGPTPPETEKSIVWGGSFCRLYLNELERIRCRHFMRRYDTILAWAAGLCSTKDKSIITMRRPRSNCTLYLSRPASS
jgi:hypothetical protein